MRLIINADDLGKGASENEAIFALVDEGLVTSVTIMANAPGFADAVPQILRRRTCSVGVHMNVTEYSSLTAAAAAGPLLQTGQRDPRLLVPTPALLKAVYQEWHAQITTVLRAGIQPSHLDSHHHIHTLPQFYTVIRQLQEDFGLRRIRRPKNLYACRSWYVRGALVWRWMCRAGLNLISDAITTDVFTDLETFLGAHERLDPSSTVEIMVHPGHPDHPDDERQLRSDYWRALSGQHDLISFADI